MTDIQAMIIRLTGDGTSYAKMMSDAVEQTKRATAQIEQYCTVIANALVKAIGKIGDLSIGEFSKFDKGITESISKMGGVSAQVREQMEVVAKNLSVSGKVIFTPTELAKAYEAMAGGGLSAVQSMKLLETAAITAQAGLMNVEEATKSLMGAMNTLGMTSKNTDEFAENMKRMSDVVVMADNKTNTSTKYLLKALTGDGARAAREWGMSLEELVGNLSVYAQQNIEASEASNLFGRAVRLSSSAMVLHKDLWKKNDINLIDETTGRWISFAEAMDKLAAATKNLDDDEYIKFAKALGLKDLSRKAILPYLGASGQAKAFTEQYKTGAEDSSLEKAALQMKSFSAQLNVLRNEFLVLAIDIGNILAPALFEVAEQVREVTRWFREMSDESKQAVVMAGVYAFGAAAGYLALVASVKIAVFVFGGLVSILVVMPVQLAINVAAWIAYKMILIAAIAATITFKTIMLLANLAVGASTITFAGFTLTIAAMTAAVATLNLALLATKVLLAGVAIVAAIASAVVFVGVLVALAAAAYAAYKAIEAFFTSFLQYSNWGDSINQIGELFKEWGKILSDVFAIAQVSMDQAWVVFVAGGKLAIIQLQMLWPPLWEKIKENAKVAAEEMGLAFRESFSRAIAFIELKYNTFMKRFSSDEKMKEFDKSGIEMGEKLAKIAAEFEKKDRELKKGAVSSNLLGEQEEARKELARATKEGMDLIEAEREKQKKLRELAEDAEGERNKIEERGRGKANLPGKVHSQIKIDQALFGSQESFRRLEHQTDMINDLFNTWADQPEDPKLAAARKFTDELEKQNNSLLNMGKSYNDILAIMEQMALTGKNIPIFNERPRWEYNVSPEFGVPDANPFGKPGTSLAMGDREGKITEVASILGDMREYLRKMSEHPTVEIEEARA